MAALLLSAAVLPACTAAYGSAVCGGPVALPTELGERREHAYSNCPTDAKFLDSPDVQEAASRRLIRHGASNSSVGTTGPVETILDDVPPDCRHEVGVKLLWTEIRRRDVEGMVVKEGIHYWGKLFRAEPGAYKAAVSYGVLKNISLHMPGLHKIGDHRFMAEVHLVHKGMKRGFLDVSHEHPDFTIVVPIDFDWAWDTKRSEVFDWLTRSNGFDGEAHCDWSVLGALRFMRNGFRCPVQRLQAEHLLKGGGRALHYSAPGGCLNMFVVSEALQVNGQQIQEVKERITHEPAHFGDVYGVPGEIVVGSALLNWDAFTVFSEGETQKRQIRFEIIRATSMLAVIAGYLLLRKKYTEGFQREITDYVHDWWVQTNLRLDHWLCTFVTWLIPFISYVDGSSNLNYGMPYEYQMALFAFFLLHMVHELVMINQVGTAIARLNRMTIVRLAFMSLVGLMHVYYHICFCFVALMHGSALWWWSCVTFVTCNILGEVVLLTIHCPPLLAFSARSFSVMHGVLEAGMKEVELKSTTDKEKLKKTHSFVEESSWSDSGVQGTYFCMSFTAEVLQLIFQMLYVMKYGNCVVVNISMCLSGFYLISGVLVTNCPSLS